MPGFTVTLKNNRIPDAPAMLKKALSAGFHSSGPIVLQGIQQQTPVATGALRASEAVTYPSETQVVFSAGKDLEGDYALYVHNGTSKMGARPFLITGVTNGQDQMRDALSAAIKDAFA